MSDLERPPILDAIVPGLPTVIEASAGTGKTWTLEQIVLDLVRSGAPVESILVVTFTDKATREMRTRVRAALRARVDAGERALLPALLSFDRATISTIHGFCQRLLREHAFTSGRAFAEERVDGRRAFSRAFQALLRTGLTEGAPSRPYLLAALASARPESLEASLRELDRERHSPLEPAFSLEALADALDALPHGEKARRALAHGVHPGVAERAAAELDALAEAWGADASVRTAPRGEALATRLPALFAWGAQTTRGQRPALPWLVERLGEHDTLGPPLGALSLLLGSPYPMLAHAVLPTLRAEVEAEKRARGGFDFDDLVTGVRDALRGPGGEALRAAVRARFRHALIDEFQDTDATQWEIFQRLFFDCEGGRTLVLIGDPKQSIYGFRGADVHTYAQARAAVVAAGGRCARLGESHRARPPLVDALHEILVSRPGETPFFTGQNAYPEPVRAARTDLVALDGDGREVPPITLLHLVRDEAEGEGNIPLKVARAALARAIALEVARLLGEPLRVLDRERGTLRPLRASDVFVLTRTGREGEEVAAALRARGLPYAFFKQDGLFATAEAQDLLDVLRALVSPDDVRLRARALATPFFGVAPEDLARARTLAPTHPLSLRFEGLAARARASELGPLFRALTDETGVVERALYLHASERRLTNTLHLAELLLGLAHRKRLGLRELTLELAALVAGRASARGSEGEEEDVQRLETEREAVQLATMHKSKGLEAEVVFLFGGFWQRAPRADTRRVFHADGARTAWIGPAPRTIEAAIAREDDEESERLLYVAMTRARSCLYLPYAGPGPGQRPGVGAPMALNGPMRVLARRLRAIVPTLPREGSGGPSTGLRCVPVRVDEARPRGVARGGRPPSMTHAEVIGAVAAEGMRPHAYAEAIAVRAGLELTSYTRMKARRARALEEADESLDLRALHGEEGLPDEDLDTGNLDTGNLDTGNLDTGNLDTGNLDTGNLDTGTLDTGNLDTGNLDTGNLDTGNLDTGNLDTGNLDTGNLDTGNLDTGNLDTGNLDTGNLDTGNLDTGNLDTGNLPPDARGGPGGTALGLVVHALLERLADADVRDASDADALAALPSTQRLAAQACAQHGLAAEAQGAAIALAFRGLRAPLVAPALGLSLPDGLVAVTRRAAEVPFLHPIPEAAHPPLGAPPPPDGLSIERGFLRGVFDVLFEHEGRLYVLDWKTDRLASSDPRALAALVEERYALQLKLYALAAARLPGLAGPEAWEARFGGVVYVFLRALGGTEGAGIFAVRPDAVTVAAWDTTLRTQATPWGYPLARRATLPTSRIPDGAPW